MRSNFLRIVSRSDLLLSGILTISLRAGTREVELGTSSVRVDGNVKLDARSIIHEVFSLEGGSSFLLADRLESLSNCVLGGLLYFVHIQLTLLVAVRYTGENMTHSNRGQGELLNQRVDQVDTLLVSRCLGFDIGDVVLDAASPLTAGVSSRSI